MSLIEGIPALRGSDEIRPITEGFSSDAKYRVRKGGQSFLLRTFPAGSLGAKEAECQALQMMLELGVRCSRPLEWGLLPGGEQGYVLLTYLEGLDGEQAMPRLDPKAQYNAGLEAGRELWKMHQVAAPPGVSTWEVRKLAKMDRYLAQYLAGCHRIPNEGALLKVLEDFRPLLKNRPNLFQHDDFHLRNLVFQGESLAGVIDFGRHDWGDPVHEFLKVGQFSAEISVPFCVGQIRGYFGGRDPEGDFWPLYLLYQAAASVSFVIWTQSVCPAEMPKTMAILERVLRDHDDFQSPIPAWYSGYGGN